jgi:hypothetical protein
MQSRIIYKIAKIYNQLGYDEPTSYLYLNIANGLKTVKGDLNNPVGEQIYHTGDLAKYDEEWGIIYPSPYWIPAPYVYDIVIWLEKTYGLKIILENDEHGWCYKFNFSNIFTDLKLDSDLLNNKSFNSLQDIYENNLNKKHYFNISEFAYENAVNEIAICADKYNWITKLYKFI